MKNKLPKQSRLLSLFSYDEVTGVLTRLTRTSNGNQIGDVLGDTTSNEYQRARVDGKKYQIHNIIWKMVYGYDPIEVDHINHVRSDNRLCNIREVTRTENMKNKSMRKDNTSGQIGVNFSGNRWLARINVDGQRVYLGSFVMYHEAVDARKNAEQLYGYHENHGKG